MYRTSIITITLLFAMTSFAQASLLEGITRSILTPKSQSSAALDTDTTIKGLKEALATGTERAVSAVSQTDGYFGNQMIKILLPDKLQKAGDLMSKFGFQQEVDDFILSMNRAAEKAAPTAVNFFGDAIRSMSVEDAKGILTGGDTAATEFFEKKTRDKLFDSFKPTVSDTISQTGVTNSYQNMVGKLNSMPLASMLGSTDLDLDNYVTNKALDGLFTMLGEEEKKIRTNPLARTSELLQKVFGK
jgi:hypothetical protein